MFDAQTAEAFVDDMIGFAEPRRPAQRQAAPEIPGYVPSHYAPRSHRGLILIVIAAHLAAIFALVQFDVVRITPKRPPLVVRLVPLDTPPPPKIAPPPQKEVVKLQTPIIAPPAIVPPPVTLAPPVLSAPVAVKAAPVATTSAPAAPVVAQAAPIMPPDASAANLGNVAPRYPVESRRSHEEGTVRLRVLISPEGRVEEVAVAKSSGFDRLDDAALDAVRKWRFRPGTQAGTPVEAVGFLSIPFKLTR
ncbi:energy transducer TonB [Sphingomonas bacterium]|uniref:energy transducer TonB n=1 Tax=Sphingomonas bacterium TaxID=1895847 RepID=UPI0015767D21|nr:energy transducer TonB [Sphingomonas bacterium]